MYTDRSCAGVISRCVLLMESKKGTCSHSCAASAALCMTLTVANNACCVCDWSESACLPACVNRACVKTGCVPDSTYAFTNYFPSVIIFIYIGYFAIHHFYTYATCGSHSTRTV